MLMLSFNDNLFGRQFKAKEDIHSIRSGKILKGSLGVIGHTIDYPHVDPLLFMKKVSIVLYRMGKTGKFRLSRREVTIPLFNSSIGGKKANIVGPQNIVVVKQREIFKYDTDAFIAWAATRMFHYEHLIRLYKRTWGRSPGYIAQLTNRSPIQHIINNPTIDQFRMLLHSPEAQNGTLDKLDVDCLNVLRDPNLRENFVHQMLHLSVYSACLELVYRNMLLGALTKAVSSFDTALARRLLKYGCPENAIMTDKVPRKKEYEPYRSIHHALQPLIKDVVKKHSDTASLLSANNNRNVFNE